MSPKRRTPDSLTDAIVGVGSGGRGFIVKAPREQLVVTAPHCLGRDLLLANTGASPMERTIREIVGPLGEKPEVAAECLLADLIRGVVVLGEPDEDDFDEYDKFEDLVGPRPGIPVGVFGKPGPGWLLTGDGEWEQCRLELSGWVGSTLRITGAHRAAYAPGTSGSPILNADCHVVGVITGGDDVNPVLAANLRLGMVADLLGEKAGDAINAQLRHRQRRERRIKQILTRRIRPGESPAPFPK